MADKDYWKGIVWGLLIVGLIHLLFGCSKMVYVPVENTSHDTLYINKMRHDSVYLKDSVYLYTEKQGDTVYREKTVTRYAYRLKATTDTLYRTKHDTVSVPVPTARTLGLWERTKLNLCVPLAILCALLCVAVWWLIKIKSR